MTGVQQTGVVLMAYGTPRHPDEIEAYYTDIRRGRPPTAEQLADLTARYAAIGGISPLAQRTNAQRDALANALGPAFSVVLGLKHAHPMVETAVSQLAKLGITRAVGLVLAPHYSTMSIAEYQRRASAAGNDAHVEMRPIMNWHVLPEYLEFLGQGVTHALGELPARTLVLFTAHSLPARVLAQGDPYPDQLEQTANAVAGAVGLASGTYRTAWQSAGRTPEPWIGPDILEVIAHAAADGWEGVLVCPCGFVADHLEVLYDLDIEAAGVAASHGLAFARTPSMNADPSVIAALADQVRAVAENW